MKYQFQFGSDVLSDQMVNSSANQWGNVEPNAPIGATPKTYWQNKYSGIAAREQHPEQYE